MPLFGVAFFSCFNLLTMKYENYKAMQAAEDLSSFDFMSKGKNGDILNRIVFESTAIPGIYVLAFGVVTETDDIDDLSVTNNGDTAMVLATVKKAVTLFCARYPERMIYFAGSTESRTRLYRMAIGLNLEELSLAFDIFAEVDD